MTLLFDIHFNIATFLNLTIEKLANCLKGTSPLTEYVELEYSFLTLDAGKITVSGIFDLTWKA